MTHLQWEAVPSRPSADTASFADTRWFRARLPHGWLVQGLRPRKTIVGGREIEIDGSMADGASTTFVPFGPAPWN